MKFKNVVLIGLGRQGKTHFCALKELLEMGFIEKIYISDEDPNCLEALGEEWSDTIIYITERDYQTITDVLFIIATPNNTHLQILSLLKSGATILKEKPFAIDQDNFLRLQKLILDKKFNVHIAQQRYFNESYLKAKLLLSNLGKVNFFEYRYTLNDSEESWYWKKELGGGCLLNVGWHFFFLLSWFFEDTSMLIDVQSFKLSKLSLTSDVEDTAFIDIRDRDHFGKAYLSVSECKKQDVFKIIGSNGALEVNKKECIFYDTLGKEKILIKGNEELSYIKQISAILTGKNLDILGKINLKTQVLISKINVK